jgi:RNA polymerase sigma-70 factor, ECF subfamily
MIPRPPPVAASGRRSAGDTSRAARAGGSTFGFALKKRRAHPLIGLSAARGRVREDGGVNREVVERGRRGDREAYEALVREAAPRLYAIAYRILRDPVRSDDAVQQTLVAIWRELPRLRDPNRFDAWTYRLVARFCLEEARRERRVVDGVRLLAIEESSAEDSTVSIADRDQLERAFRRLTPEHRAVIVLRHYVGLSTAEIGQALSIPAGTVGSRLHYAERALRAAIEADDRVALRPGVTA